MQKIFLDRAEKLREIAEDFKCPKTKEVLETLAKEYEQMAQKRELQIMPKQPLRK